MPKLTPTPGAKGQSTFYVELDAPAGKAAHVSGQSIPVNKAGNTTDIPESVHARATQQATGIFSTVPVPVYDESLRAQLMLHPNDAHVLTTEPPEAFEANEKLVIWQHPVHPDCVFVRKTAHSQPEELDTATVKKFLVEYYLGKLGMFLPVKPSAGQRFEQTVVWTSSEIPKYYWSILMPGKEKALRLQTLDEVTEKVFPAQRIAATGTAPLVSVRPFFAQCYAESGLNPEEVDIFLAKPSTPFQPGDKPRLYPSPDSSFIWLLESTGIMEHHLAAKPTTLKEVKKELADYQGAVARSLEKPKESFFSGFMRIVKSPEAAGSVRPVMGISSPVASVCSRSLDTQRARFVVPSPAMLPQTQAVTGRQNSHGAEIALFKERMQALQQSLLHKLPQNAGKYVDDEPDLPRFANIHCMKETRVPGLHANYITIEGTRVAIAAQFPKDNQIEQHLRICITDKVDVITVLTTPEEIRTGTGARKMTDYFSVSGKHGRITTTSTWKETRMLTEGLKFRVYEVKLVDNDTGATQSVHVLHVQNWDDHKAMSATDTQELVAVQREYGVTGLVHCAAGVGRTGTVIAVGILKNKKFDDLSLERIFTVIRPQRNGHIVQTPEQMDVPITICIAQRRPLLES